jgi:PAS domain S-box-containing protein
VLWEQFLMDTLMENIPDSIYFKDVDSRFLRVNRAMALRCVLADPADAVGKTDFDFFSREHAQEALEAEREIMRTGRPVVNLEEMETAPDRPTVWVSTTKMPLRDSSGAIIGTFGVSRDITPRKEAEEALRRSEETYHSLVQDATYGICRWTIDGPFTSANPALVEMLGYGSEDEILALDLTRSLWVDVNECQRVVAGVGRDGRLEGVEGHWKRKNGEEILVRMSGRAARIAQPVDGGRPAFEMIVEDITEHRALEEQLRQSQKMEAVGRLAGGLAHDFNNLLTAVLSSCDMLGSELSADSPQWEDVKAIRNAAQRGAELTRKLLAFSRQQPLEVRPHSLAALVTDFVRLSRRVIREDIEVLVKAAAPETTITADAGAIEQILMNLVTNASDAMPAGGKLVIEVDRIALDEDHHEAFGWGSPGDYVILAVSDTGVGMEPETLRRLFEPFYSTKAVDRGTGLGMPMVYGLVKQHHGFTHVYSEPGQGTTVRLYFPAAAATGAEPERIVPVPHKPRGGSEVVLLVEDDASVSRAASRVLEKHGYTVLKATDGQEALKIMATCTPPPDLIISDVVMPRMTGPQLLSKLREAGPVPKVLFNSGYAASETLERTTLEPGIPFLRKPWTLSELLLKVREVLDA